MAITTRRAVGDNALADIHNVFETLVMREIHQLRLKHPGQSTDYWADVGCLALNQLPARYIRYDVDHSFHLEAAEQRELEAQVETAVSAAREIAGRRRIGKRD